MSTATISSLRRRALQKMENFDNLPSMPQIIERVRQISEDPRSSAADLANIVLSDHSLTAKILRVANSAYYGQYSGKVSTITQAIVLVGFNAVRSIVMGIAVYDTFSRLEKKAGFDLTMFWTRSLGCGVVAKKLAHRSGHKSSEEAFIAGFLHDIGQPVTCMIFAGDVPKIGRLLLRTDDPVRRERDKLGIDHQEVGVWLGKKWNLPPILLNPIRLHHRVGRKRRERSPEPLVDIVYAADLIVNKMTTGISTPEDIADDLESEMLQLLGIKRIDLLEVIESAAEQTRDIAVELDIQITNLTPSSESAAVRTDADTSSEELVKTTRRLSEVERELAIMREMALALREGASEEQVLQTLLEGIYRAVEFRRALLLRIDHNTNKASGLLGFGVTSQQDVQELNIPLTPGIGAIVSVVADNKPINILDTGAELYASMLDEAELAAFGAKAFCLLPMPITDDVEYVVFVENGDDQPVEDRKVRSVESFINQASMAVERLRLRRQVTGDQTASGLDSLITVAFDK